MTASDAPVPSQFLRCPGDGAPRNGRESLVLSPVVARAACLLIERSIALSFPAVPVSILPPPPLPPSFLVQPYLSRYPPDQRESIFVVVPLALSPSDPPGLGPVDLLTDVMAPFNFHPPPSYAMLVGHLRLALNRHIAVVLRSVTTPRPGRGHGSKATEDANHRAKHSSVHSFLA